LFRAIFVEVRVDRLTQAETKIGLLHHVGGGNLGDDATLEAVAGNIRRRWPKAEIVAFSMNPDDIEARHGIMSHPIQRKCWTVGYRLAGTEGLSRRPSRR
jgi:polysaccharide pyruvyl transferase WcaK-like protein